MVEFREALKDYFVFEGKSASITRMSPRGSRLDVQYQAAHCCEGIAPAPIVRPVGRPRGKRIKNHVDMIIGNKVKKTCQVICSKCGEKSHYYKTCKGAPKNPN
ncbi:hypothetical protein PIB30_063461 [Stylosanthes scabra]|uniref:CCHC-type domain-containing protein n=1 Tax=Stylosanthes scabra TaxID=79078 RepID=A0ABU6TLP3_9FABA|nr:hypothetical protein [Stylosanthes scabra]